MGARHLYGRVFNLVDHVLKYLPIRKHPVAVEKEEDWCVTEQSHGVHGHLVVHRGWQLEAVGNLISLSRPEKEVGNNCNWE